MVNIRRKHPREYPLRSVKHPVEYAQSSICIWYETPCKIWKSSTCMEYNGNPLCYSNWTSMGVATNIQYSDILQTIEIAGDDETISISQDWSCF